MRIWPRVIAFAAIGGFCLAACIEPADDLLGSETSALQQVEQLQSSPDLHVLGGDVTFAEQPEKKISAEIWVHLAPLGNEAWPGNQDPYEWYLQQGSIATTFDGSGRITSVTYDMYVCSGWNCPGDAIVHLGAVISISYNAIGFPSITVTGCVSFRTRTRNADGTITYGPWVKNCDPAVVSQYMQGLSYNMQWASTITE